MNTLSKEITLGRFFAEDPENYAKIKAHWSKMVNSDYNVTLTMSHHILYLILMGKNWQKAVTLPTNKNKLANHYKPEIKDVEERWGSTFIKENVLHSFGGLVTEEMYKNARMLTDLDMSKEPYKDFTTNE
jgi:hypothetical protein